MSHAHIAYGTPKATNTHSYCVMLKAFPLQQRLNKRAWTIHYTYIACLVPSFLLCFFACLLLSSSCFSLRFFHSCFFVSFFPSLYICSCFLYVPVYSLFYSFFSIPAPFITFSSCLVFSLFVSVAPNITHLSAYCCVIAVGGMCVTYGDQTSALWFW